MSPQNSTLKNRRQLIAGSENLATLEQARQFAKKLHSVLPSKCIICLEGPMGVGKTQLVRFLVEELGPAEVSSPTFALQNVYLVAGKQIRHFDLHRLEAPEEIESSGLWEAFDSDGWVLIEWAGRLNLDELPFDWPICTIDYSSDRKVSWVAYAASEFS